MDPGRRQHDEAASLAARLRGVLRGNPVVRLAVLFGSAAGDRLRPDSDLDVAFIPVDPELPLREELDLAVDLARACGRPVDLVRLDTASTLLRWQVARHGVPLAATDPGAWPRFVAAAACEYLDAEPALRAAAQLYARRLAGTP